MMTYSMPMQEIKSRLSHYVHGSKSWPLPPLIVICLLAILGQSTSLHAQPQMALDAYVKAGNTDPTDLFGYSVAVSGNTAVVGAPSEDSRSTGVNSTPDNYVADSGAAYVFVRTGTTWTQQAYLKPSNTGPNDYFGWSVAVEGNTVVVGAPSEDSSNPNILLQNNNAPNSGAAYVFLRNLTTWTQQAYLKASNIGPYDYFGDSVSVSGDTVVVGAPSEASSNPNILFQNNNAPYSGAAYVFVRTGTTWMQQAYVKASNTDPDDLFGYSVALSGSWVVVGAIGEDSNTTGLYSTPNNNANESGAAYIYGRKPSAMPMVTGGGGWEVVTTVGESFSYTITADNAPTRFDATDLPEGLRVNTATGEISGRPTKAGTSVITIYGSNEFDTVSETLILTVSDDNPAPVASAFQIITGGFTWHQAKADAVTRGGRLAVLNSQAKINQANAVLLLAAGTLPDLWIGMTDEVTEGEWHWITGDLLSVANWNSGEPNNGGGDEDYGYIWGNAWAELSPTWNDSSNDPHAYLLEVFVLGIVNQPESQTVIAGANVAFGVAANGANPLTYQWYKDGVIVPNATKATVILTNVQAANAANYTVVISSATSSTTSSAATLTVTPPEEAPPIISINYDIAQGRLSLIVQGEANREHVIEYTTDFTQWTPLATNVLGSTDWTLEASQAPDSPTSYYRVFRR